MIELKSDELRFAFPEVHADAACQIDFQRTLRIPDDEDEYPLPPGVGRFPLRHVDDHAGRIPARWIEHGGIMLPMFQSEALWLNFGEGGPGGRGYPCAVKIATGKINAVTGEAWINRLTSDPQDYVVAPAQPWLDGYCVEKGIIRQFVAMPLGSGYTAEEQLTGAAEHGGMQIVVYPMKADVYERMRRADRTGRMRLSNFEEVACAAPPAPGMGLAPGGRMHQEIHDDPYGIDAWDLEHGARCFVHMANSLVWSSITGSPPPHPAPTAAEYTRAGLPWFDLYREGKALGGSAALKGLESVAQRGARKGETPLPENEPVTPEVVVSLRRGLREGQVREGRGWA